LAQIVKVADSPQSQSRCEETQSQSGLPEVTKEVYPGESP